MRRRRRWPWVVAVLVGVVVATGAWFVTEYVTPTQAEPFADGPVLVLGGDPSRAAFAAELVPQASADRPVWLSYSRFGWEAAGRACDEDHVTCIAPEVESTWGEVQAAAELAAEHGWEQVTVVTSAFHRARAGSLMRRCLDVPVRVSGPPAAEPVGWSLARQEALATVVSAVVFRDC